MQQCHFFHTQLDLTSHLNVDITIALIRKLLESLDIKDDDNGDDNDFGNNVALKNVMVDCTLHLQSLLHSSMSRLGNPEEHENETLNIIR